MRKKNKLVYGVGINDADYTVAWYEMVDGKLKKKTCPFYRTWSTMLARCYSEKYLAKKPSYRGSRVCDEWLRFSTFKAWMVEQDWKDENGKKKQLDKDLLSGSNRGKLYSPETCLFVSGALNSFLAFEQSVNNSFPVGVYWNSDVEKYQAEVNNSSTGGREYLGVFTTPEAASAAYCARKKEIAKKLAETVKDPRIKQILLDFEVPKHLRGN